MPARCRSRVLGGSGGPLSNAATTGLVDSDALTRLGEMLKATTKATGGDAQRTRFNKGTESPPTLADLGIDKKVSMVAARLANLRDGQRADRAASIDAPSVTQQQAADLLNVSRPLTSRRRKAKRRHVLGGSGGSAGVVADRCSAAPKSLDHV